MQRATSSWATKGEEREACGTHAHSGKRAMFLCVHVCVHMSVRVRACKAHAAFVQDPVLWPRACTATLACWGRKATERPVRWKCVLCARSTPRGTQEAGPVRARWSQPRSADSHICM